MKLIEQNPYYNDMAIKITTCNQATYSNYIYNNGDHSKN